MRIRDYQTWLQSYDVERGWDRITRAHTFLHLAEELGEIAREVQYIEGYRDAEGAGDVRAHLAEELADAATFLFKLAYLCDIDLEDALLANMDKAERRFSVDDGRADTARYLNRQAEILTRIQNDDPG
jgi:NTP pyrophosphatase (non-canonical NTP hydrolase)